MDKSDHCREVYAHYGIAMYLAQCVEQSLFQMIMMFDFFPNNVPKKVSRKYWIKIYEQFEEGMTKKTMGQILGQLKNLKIVEDGIEEQLNKSLKIRNYLAHRFFVDHGLNFINESGRNKMIKELEEHQNVFQHVEDTLVPIVAKVMKEYGFTEEMLRKAEQELFEESGIDL